MPLEIDLVQIVRVVHEDGSVEYVEPDDLADFLRTQWGETVSPNGASPTTPAPAKDTARPTTRPANPGGSATTPIEGGWLRECGGCGEPMPTDRQRGPRPMHDYCVTRGAQPTCTEGGDAHYWKLGPIADDLMVSGTCKNCDAKKRFPAFLDATAQRLRTHESDRQEAQP